MPDDPKTDDPLRTCLCRRPDGPLRNRRSNLRWRTHAADRSRPAPPGRQRATPGRSAGGQFRNGDDGPAGSPWHPAAQRGGRCPDRRDGRRPGGAHARALRHARHDRGRVRGGAPPWRRCGDCPGLPFPWHGGDHGLYPRPGRTGRADRLDLRRIRAGRPRRALRGSRRHDPLVRARPHEPALSRGNVGGEHALRHRRPGDEFLGRLGLGAGDAEAPRDPRGRSDGARHRRGAWPR